MSLPETPISTITPAEPGETGKVLGTLISGVLRLFDTAPWSAARGKGKLAVSTQFHTLALADEGKTIVRTNSVAGGIIIPLNSVVAWPIGGWVEIIRLGTGALEVQIPSGVTLHSGTGRIDLRAAGSCCKLRKIGTDEWVMYGDTN